MDSHLHELIMTSYYERLVIFHSCRSVLGLGRTLTRGTKRKASAARDRNADANNVG